MDSEGEVYEGRDAPIPSLPALSIKPTAYPGCCLALSSPLVSHLRTILPPSPSMTLSIGSGYGLLEAILLQAPDAINIAGVEVKPTPNKYLPARVHYVVNGSRFLEPRAANANAWLFVYPRRPALVGEYLAAHNSEKLKQIVWIGPQADWSDYKGFLGSWEVSEYSADTVGGRPWELIAVARKTSL